jgi:hypothetical protein
MAQKILYLSAHSILEYDEVKMFHELGYEVFSPGAYVEPANPGDASLRPGIPTLAYNPDLLTEFHAIGAAHPGEDNKNYLTLDFVKHFDTVVVMHLPRWIEMNWPVFEASGKRIIWRTIGQSVIDTEKKVAPYRARGLQIVRYSPKEELTPHFCGSDGLIRFYKDPDELKDWNGSVRHIINFSQSMKQREPACNYSFFEEVTRPFPRRLFGPGNEGLNWSTGKVTYEQQKQEMRNARAYFYTGTHPASYTLNFMEAWMTGTPIVAIGPKHGNASYFPGCHLYEVHELITNGVNGFISDDINELRVYIKALLTDPTLAAKISSAGRQEAIRHFGRDMIFNSWKAFLG